MHLLRLAVLLMALCTGWTGAAAQSSTQVEVGGAVQRKLVLGVAELAAYKAEQTGSFVQPRGSPGAETRSTVRGVRLAALIEQAGLTAKGPHEWKSLVVVATATDGYRAVFSWPELVNTPVGDGVLVLFERDGQALDEREGRIALISGADRRTGPRHVRNLARIEVRALD